jgi:hypothetical protein
MADTEYISKEAALACFTDWIDRYGHEHTADEIVEYQRIEDLPEEDVRPVVRGKWIDGKCDQCGEHAPYWCMASTYHTTNFCPNCGADMREVETDG